MVQGYRRVPEPPASTMPFRLDSEVTIGKELVNHGDRWRSMIEMNDKFESRDYINRSTRRSQRLFVDVNFINE